MNLIKVICTVFVITITVESVYSQVKRIDICRDDQDFYNTRAEAEKKAHLPDMTVIKDGRHWRFWYDKYIACSFIIDVIKPDSVKYQAFITIYTYGDVKWDDKNKFGKVYYKKICLADDIADSLYKVATHININRFARKDTLVNSADRIYKGVRIYQIMDAMPYTVEYADEKNYTFKTGLRPENATQFEALINTATKLIDFQNLKDNFTKNIPLGYYSASKWQFLQRKLTVKQQRQYNRYWQKHTE